MAQNNGKFVAYFRVSAGRQGLGLKGKRRPQATAWSSGFR